MQVTLTTIGDAVGLILPPEVLERMGVSVGDTLYLSDIADGIVLTLQDREYDTQMAAANRVMEQDREALKRLAE